MRERDTAKPILGIRLQHHSYTRGGRTSLSGIRHSARPDVGQRGYGVQLDIGSTQQPEAENHENMISRLGCDA